MTTQILTPQKRKFIFDAIDYYMYDEDGIAAFNELAEGRDTLNMSGKDFADIAFVTIAPMSNFEIGKDLIALGYKKYMANRDRRIASV